MNDYYKVEFTFAPYTEDESDILSSLLCEIDYESFENAAPSLYAYIKKEHFSQDAIKQVISQYPFSSTIEIQEELIIGKDWNEEWEKNYFTPMLIGERCIIHSTFHHDYPKAEYDIVIDPKMAFGTGHHETTTLMVEELLNTNLQGKSVMDMGTGTGILAILAAMRGATQIKGIEIDPPAYVNAIENVSLNHVPNVEIMLGDASLLDNDDTKYDLLLANINRNIILQDIDKYANALKKNGYMQLSGFYEVDVPMIIEAAGTYGLNKAAQKEKNNWTMLLLHKK